MDPFQRVDLDQQTLFRPSPSPSPSQSNDADILSEAQPSANLFSQDSAYARRHRKLLDQLIAIGIQSMIKVPKVAVVGSQSAGKSSILEALSRITLPRDSGTCTRCPTELRLFSTEQEWVCQVSLRFEKDEKGNKLEKIDTVKFGPPITDPSNVESRLRQAQRAILNPSKDPQSFLRRDATSRVDTDGPIERNKLQFSENVICIDVSGKGYRDLSVVDLPGIIANTEEKEDEGNIALIQGLARDVIKEENCIILCCISMNEDYQTQPSVRLAKEADATGKRTLGVLTKPDRVEGGVFKIWKPVIEGHQQKLLHGYYSVMNPKPEELGKKTWEQAREDEKRFFREGDWAMLDPRVALRLGSENLAGKLEALLEQLITEKMPKIIKKVKSMHRKVQKELLMLPKPVQEGYYVAQLDSLIKTFAEELKHNLLDSKEEDSLAHVTHMISLNFWADMINHRPRFLPLTATEVQWLQASDQPKVVGLQKIIEMRDYLFDEDKAELTARGGIEERVWLGDSVDSSDVSEGSNEEDEEEEELHDKLDESGESGNGDVRDKANEVDTAREGIEPAHKALVRIDDIQETAEDQRMNVSNDEYLAPYLLDIKSKAIFYGCSSVVNIDLNDSTALCNLTKISKIKAMATMDLLPGNIPWSVKKRLIGDSIKGWPTVSSHALESIETHLLKECKALVSKHFSRYRVGGLESIVIQISEQLIADTVKHTRAILEIFFDIESWYTTINTHDYLQRVEKLKKEFAAARKACVYPASATGETGDAADAAEPTPVFYENVDEELSLVAEVLVYWQIAFKRYTDNVRGAFRVTLLQPIAKGCLERLTSGLRILEEDATTRTKELLQEEADIVRRRDALLVRLDTLTQSLEVIDAFNNGGHKIEHEYEGRARKRPKFHV